MTRAPSSPTIFNVTDLLAVAYGIETDAVERYMLLADQMDTHNNPELTKVFRDLARAEGIHAEEIHRLAGDANLNERAQALRASWSGESPEEVDLGAAHYLMTPWHALQLTLAAEKRALTFFSSIADSAKDAKIKEMAGEFVEEEAEHVNLVYRLMRKYPKPKDSALHDSDPPSAQD